MTLRESICSDSRGADVEGGGVVYCVRGGYSF